MAQEDLKNIPHSAQTSRDFDAFVIKNYGIPGEELMQRAGQFAFDVLRKEFPNAEKILIVCGPGNNGGDGKVVHKLAIESGLKSRVVDVNAEFEIQDEDVIVDGIFGTGLARDVSGFFAESIQKINDSKIPVLSLDIPSGLCADTGKILGVTVKANVTTVFLLKKHGLYTGAGPNHCGKIHFTDLEVSDEVYRDFFATQS